MKTFCRIISIMLLSGAFLPGGLNAQEKNVFEGNPVSLSGFLQGVVKGNLGYIAEQLNVNIAEAELQASRVFPDPELSVIYSNNEDKRLQMGQTLEAGLTYPVNTGNRRKAGINLARAQYELSEIILDSYFNNLRADATLGYFAGIRDREKYLLMVDMHQQVQELARADSIRYQTGEISFIDALQSSLEARSLQALVLESHAEMKNTFLNLMILQGKKTFDILDIPADSLLSTWYDVNLSELVDNAVFKRADLLAALKNKEVSEKALNLLKAERAFEFSLETGYSYNSIVLNEIAPAPAFNGISAGISVPLKFSGLNRGSLRSAELAIRQNDLLYEEAELQIRAEVVMAYNNYTARGKMIEHYNLGLINDAQKILAGKISSYQKGESDLIEVINAQRTYLDLQSDYIDALFEFSSSLVELERAAGVWDISM